ncbi:MAG TPA: prolyl oligopeptidase family serine peptidase [Gemmatimonadaceae bacterium]|nr:prolyl oligopeptidase family serine peptidase [Gemmatimonadaceae bacterium]
MSLPLRRLATRVVLLPACILATAPALFAQAAPAASEQSGTASMSPQQILDVETYIRPPAEIERLVTAPRQDNLSLTNLSPDRTHFLELKSGGMPSVQTFGRPHYYFAGLQVDERGNRARTLTDRGAAALEIIDATTGRVRTIDAPKGATISSPAWSPDGSQIAFIANFDASTRLYVADVASGKMRQVTAAPLLPTLVTDLEWTADGKNIVTVLIPEGRGAEPQRPAIETGPLVRITDSLEDKTRVYASLLRDEFDKHLMQYYITSQLALVDAKSGAVHRIGAPAMIEDVDASPDGKYFRVTRMEEPFSYIVQYGSFPRSEELWDANGKVVAQLSTRPLQLPQDRSDDGPGARAAQDTMPRDFGWLPNGAGLYYLEQAPAPRRARGDANGADTNPSSPRGGTSARRKDRLYAWAPPFDASSKKVLMESDNRIGSVLFSDDASMAFVAENTNGTGYVYAVYFNEPTKRYTIWRLRGLNASVGTRGRGFFGGRGGSGADSVTFYENPGSIMTKRSRSGVQVALLSSDGASAYLEGTHYFKDWQTQAPRGFVDRVDIKSGQKTPVFEGASDAYETVTAVLDDNASKIIVERQSPTVVPDSYLRDTRSNQTTQLTHNVDFTPEFTHAIRKRIEVTRADGYHFMVDLTLPQDYKPGTRLPTMFWFYPYEYTDQAGYDRTLRTENINQFPRAGARTIEYLVTQGYAVANFDPPIVGDAGRMNDNYVSDLQNDLIAVIDELDRDGYIDRTRLGIGGHSYGAFSTVNAMVHTPYFKAGIAGDGMYNRSLTPNGFQNERRDFWNGQKVYLDMSPFMYADKLTGALLMYHSMEDQNVGTALESSTRMMHALEGLGKTAALYVYPYEDHGPLTKETILDQWARWVAWLDLYVKNAGKPAVAVTKAASATPQ